MRFSGAEWIGPTDNRTINGMSTDIHGLVLHIMDGTEAGTEAWFKNRAAKASSHFLNPRSGNLRQLIDTADRSWAQADGNSNWISVENEGRGGNSLTDSQIANLGSLFQWISRAYNVPIQSTDDPNGRGLGWHGMGGRAWGNHPDCPGVAVLAQRGRILALASGHPSSGLTPFPGSSFFHVGQSSDIITRMGRRLVEVGCGSHYQVGPGPDWSEADRANYADWQRKCGYSGSDADGYPGLTSWNRLQVPAS
jgi:hypothetical protein